MTAMVSRPDIADRADIAGLVTEFYRRAFADALLGPIFVDVAKVDMSVHLPVMCDFWETVLLRAGRYHRNALRPHLGLNSTVELTAVCTLSGGSRCGRQRSTNVMGARRQNSPRSRPLGSPDRSAVGCGAASHRTPDHPAANARIRSHRDRPSYPSRSLRVPRPARH